MKAMSRTVGMAGLACLSSASMAADPAVDCKTAKLRSIERLMCRSPMLPRLDQELTRLYALATSPKAGAAARGIRTQQRHGLHNVRTAPRARRRPVRSRCLSRTHRRDSTQSRSARSADDKGISLGPFAFKCEGADARSTMTFVNVDPGLAWVTIKDRSYPLIQQRSGSGARYEGDGTLFWEHQGERGGAAPPTRRRSRASARRRADLAHERHAIRPDSPID